MEAGNDVLETSVGLTMMRGEEMALESKGIPSPDMVTMEGGNKEGQCPSIEVLGDHRGLHHHLWADQWEGQQWWGEELFVH